MTEYRFRQHLDTLIPLMSASVGDDGETATLSHPGFEAEGYNNGRYEFSLEAGADWYSDPAIAGIRFEMDISSAGPADHRIAVVLLVSDAIEDDFATTSEASNRLAEDFAVYAPLTVGSYTWELTSGPRTESSVVWHTSFGAGPLSIGEVMRRAQLTDFRHLKGQVSLINFGGPFTISRFQVIAYTLESAAWYEPPLRQYPRQDDRASMGVRRMWPRTDPRRIGHIP